MKFSWSSGNVEWCVCVAHFKVLPPSFWFSVRRHKTAEVVLIINLLARKLSRVVYTGAIFRLSRSSSNSWSDSRRVASKERCFHLSRYLSQCWLSYTFPIFNGNLPYFVYIISLRHIYKYYQYSVFFRYV